MSTDNKNIFYEKTLWTGRLASFTKTINSNLKLLRVILLTKGSSIMEFGLFLEEGEELLLSANENNTNSTFIKINEYKAKMRQLNESEGISALRNKIEQHEKTIQTFKDEINKAKDSNLWDKAQVVNTLINIVQNDLSDPSEQTNDINELPGEGAGDGDKVGGSYSHDAHSMVDFDFEERQLYNLRTLSRKQKKFVKDRLETSVTSTLESAEAHSKVALIRESFGRMAKDIEIVQRAIVQRVHEVDDTGKYAPSMQANALQITDKLALEALEPFQRLLPADSAITPITFFSQETHVQGVPYCDDVVLIGIRYDQVLQQASTSEIPPLPFELLAIPHEVGHYIYQRANLENIRSDINTIVSAEFNQIEWLIRVQNPDGLSFKDVGENLPFSEDYGQDAVDRYKKWCEEIFSDICGCIVAGPLVALSLLSILASRADAENQIADGEHPTGTLRPFILKEILTILQELRADKYQFNEAAEGLIDSWKDIQSKFGQVATEDTEKLDAIRPIIRVFARILLEAKLLHPDGRVEELPDYTVWSEKNVKNLSEYATELVGIEDLPRLQNITASVLNEDSPQDQSDAIEDLLAEWKRKGPVTIGDHT